LPGEGIGEFGGAEVFGLAQGVEETVAEEFGHLGVASRGHAVEAVVRGEEAVGGEEVEVGVEEQAECSGDGLAWRLHDSRGETPRERPGARCASHGVEDGGCGLEDEVEEVAALMAGGAEVATPAGEGEEVLRAAIGAAEAEEA
jgi:hypothetical protein